MTYYVVVVFYCKIYEKKNIVLNPYGILNKSVVVSFCASGDYAIISEFLKWRDCVKIISPKLLKKEY